MASDINVLSDSKRCFSVEVKEFKENIYIVENAEENLRGILIPNTEKYQIAFNSVLNIFKMGNNDGSCHILNNEDKLICVPDSTLNHSNDANSVGTNNDGNKSYCSNCKVILGTPSKRKRLHRFSEVDKLVKHGFNESILKLKNSRRGKSPAQSQSKEGSSVSELESNLSKEDSTLPIRKIRSRALKTKANAQIIVICSPRTKSKIMPKEIILNSNSDSKLKSKNSELINATLNDDIPQLETKIVKKRKSKNVEVNTKNKIKKVKNKPIMEKSVNDKKCASLDEKTTASVYDFVDEDMEFELANSSIPMPKENIRNTIELTKTDPTLKKSKITATKSNKTQDKADTCSTSDVTSFENRGLKYHVNDIVWARIPGSPLWPAHIVSFDSNSKLCQLKCINWNHKPILSLKSVLHFKDHFKTSFSTTRKSTKYRTAVEKACSELGLNAATLKPRAPRRRKGISSQDSKTLYKKSINLDDIFNSVTAIGPVSGDANADDLCGASYSDEDTDEEEKARSALITAESLETRKKFGGFMHTKEMSD